MDEEEVTRNSQGFFPIPLDDMSVGDMEDYIARLEAEVVRVRAAIDKRGGHLSAAEKLFKS